LRHFSSFALTLVVDFDGTAGLGAVVVDGDELEGLSPDSPPPLDGVSERPLLRRHRCCRTEPSVRRAVDEAR